MKIYLTPEESQKLYDVIDRDTTIHRVRNRAIFYLAKYCALRVSELARLNLCDYNIENSHIHCRRINKSIDNDIIIYDEKVKSVLNDFYRIRCAMNIDDEHLFLSQMKKPISKQMLDCLMKEYCKQADIAEEKQHFHVLKHTRAMELLSLGFSINELQWWLGHKNVINTLEYLNDDTEVDEKVIYEKIKKGRAD